MFEDLLSLFIKKSKARLKEDKGTEDISRLSKEEILQLGIKEFVLGRIGRAEKYFKAYLKQEDNNLVYYLISEIYRNKGDYERSFNIYQQIIYSTEVDVEIYYNSILGMIKVYPSIKSDLKKDNLIKILKGLPEYIKNVVLREKILRVLLENRLYEESVILLKYDKELRKYINIDENYIELLRAIYLYEDKDLDKSMEILNKIENKISEEYRKYVFYYLGLIYYKKGEKEESFRYLKDVMKWFPESYKLYSDLLYELGKFEEIGRFIHNILENKENGELEYYIALDYKSKLGSIDDISDKVESFILDNNLNRYKLVYKYIKILNDQKKYDKLDNFLKQLSSKVITPSINTWTCNNCGYENSLSFDFCKVCGTKREKK